jgi:Na+/melibiose symporter-like transporter
VFYLNLPFGLLAVTVILLAYPPTRRTHMVRVDWLGAALLFAGISALLIALGADTGGGVAAGFAVAAALLLVAFVTVERRVAEPILPLDLLKTPLIARTIVVVFLVGMALFGAIAFIPLFVQGVMGATATQAGQVLTPLFMGWVIMSIASARLTVKLGYRRLAITGSVLMTIGFIALTMVGADSARSSVLAAGLFIGSGMGLSMLSLLLAVQHGVDRSQLGLATSLNQFARSVGAVVGVAAMGAMLARGLSGFDLPGGVQAMSASSLRLEGPARLQFAHALSRVFAVGGILSGVGLIVSLVLPRVDFSRGVPAGAGEQLLAAEMTNLESDDEPEGVADGATVGTAD